MGNTKPESIFTRRHRQMNKRPRVLIGKVGLDGHDVGARVVSKSLADSGIEVIYTGLRQRSEQIVRAAIEEDADMIGISIMSGSHMTFLPEIIRLLDHYEANDIQVIVGGIITAEDIQVLKQMGVKEVFLPETPLSEINSYVISHTKKDNSA